MPSRLRPFLTYLVISSAIAAGIWFIIFQISGAGSPTPAPSVSASSSDAAPASQAAAAVVTLMTATPLSAGAQSPAPLAASSSRAISNPVTVSVANSAVPVYSNPATAAGTTSQATRIQSPYSSAPETFTTINTAARAALVNILCMPRSGGSLAPISGSGVIIDPRGVILTNAHVAQYVLLSEDAQVNLSCQIRIGAPASAAYATEVLYIPPVWVNAHVTEINTAHPMGTGEHDYALLRITGTVGNQNLPATFPYLPFDTREAIGFLGDQVLGASYPAEFLGGMAAENDLYPVSSISPISQLLTFASSTVDVISIGGVVEAQSGSSGGPVVNQWGYLIGLIATTSDAPTTAARDLRAITLSYINRDIETQTGSSLSAFLSGDLAAKESSFNNETAPGLLKQYLRLLSQ